MWLLGVSGKCGFECWELTVRNRDGLGGPAGVYRREENQDVVISLEMGTESEEGSQPKLCYRAGDETWRNAERGENLKLACLFTW